MNSNPTQSSLFRKWSAAALLALMGMAFAHAQSPASPAPAAAAPAAAAGTVINLEGRGHGPVEKTTKVATVAGPDANSTAIQVTIPDGTEGKKYRVNAKGEVSAAISAEQAVTVTFMARSPGGNKVLVMVHTGTNPDRVKLINDVQLTPEWKAYKVKGAKAAAFAAGEACVDFMMGAAPGVIEISNVVLTQ